QGAGGLPALARGGEEHDGCQERHAHLRPGGVISMPHLRCDRRQVVPATRCWVVAAVHHHAAERQMNEVAALEVAPRPLVAVGRDASMDEPWVLPGESVPAEADR